MATKAPSKKSAMPKKPVSTGMGSMSMSDKSWQARDDMHTLKQAEQIKADPNRHTAAVHHAKQEVAAMQKVARKKV